MSRYLILPTALLALILSFVLGSVALPTRAADEPTPFAVFVDDYFDAYYTHKPSEGTAAGFHRYDTLLEDFSAPKITRRIDIVKAQLDRLSELRAGKLSDSEAIDAEVLNGILRSELLDLETFALWRKNPMSYVSTPSGAVDGLMKRSFAPPATRLKSVIARLKLMPQILTALRANMDDPPKEFTDLAIHQGKGAAGFFRSDVPAWARDAAGKDTELLKEFNEANAAVIKSLSEAVAWMEKDLLPKSKGKYAVGSSNYAKKLLYDELVDIPLDRLLAIGQKNLERDQATFREVAKKIDPRKTPAEVMKSLSDDYPTEDDLIPSGKRTIEKTRQFLIDKHIVTIPSEVRPTVQETPPYARDGGFASMDTPGAYETKATEAFYYITPVEKDWDAKRKEEHLRLFNASVMQIVTIHEAYPGHYIQFLYAKDYPTKVRKLTYCGSNVEGWAHYCEQMAIEESYGGGDPKLHLAQLSEALLRDCRFVVGIKLHTQGMTVEEGAKVFEKEGFQEPSTAYEEARRGAYNPTYLYYTLGKLQIYKLRDDYRKAKGKDYKLETFHNEFVRQGGLPIKLIRRILLPGDTGPTL
jgi:uncharacterized protein (DUF885 family)